MIILASDGISETKCCQHKADHCYQSFNRQHPLSPPFPDSLSGFYVNRGSQSLRGGLTAYHPGSPKEILPHFDRDFNRIHFGVGKVAGSIFNIVLTSRRYKKDWKTLILSGFQSKCPLFELDLVMAFPRTFIVKRIYSTIHFVVSYSLYFCLDFLLTSRKHHGVISTTSSNIIAD